MKRPITLTIAVVLQWIGAVLTIIAAVGIILGAFATMDSTFRTEIDKALTENDISGISAGAITGGLFVGGLIVAAVAVLRVIVAFSLARGHNWARILISVFAVLNLLASIGYLFGGLWWNAIIGIVVEGITLFLLWNAASSAYIREKTAERALAG